MKRLLAIVLTLAAVPAAAQNAPTPQRARAANEAEARRLFVQAQALKRSGDAAGARALLDQVLALLPEPSPQRGFIQCIRGMEHLPDTLAIARPAIEECKRLAPGPMADMAGIELMVADDQLEPAVRAMVRLIRAKPEVMTDCDTSSVGQIATWLRLLTYQRLDALRGELVEALIGTPCGQNDAAFFSGLARKTIIERVARGDREAAAGLLPAVIDPEDLLILLIDPRLGSIRSELEKQAGPTLVPQREALLQSARNAAARSSNPEARQGLASVLARTGHRGEAIAVLRALLDAAQADDSEYYQRGVTASRLAGYLNDDGEADVARVTAPMRRVLAAGEPRDLPGLWNVVPNLALWLLNYGRAQEALAVLDRYRPGADDIEAPAAHAYFTALRGCAQLRLGDPQARATLDSVRTGDANNLGARRLAVLCGPEGAAQRNELLAIATDPNDGGSTLLKLVRLRTVGLVGKGPAPFEDAAMLRALADQGFAVRLDALTRRPAPSYRGALASWN